MGRLFRLEWKKLLHQRYLLFFCALLLAVDLFNIYENYDKLLSPREDVFTVEGVTFSIDRDAIVLHRDFEGPITQEKIDRLNALLQKAKAEEAQIGYGIWTEGYFPVPGVDRSQGERLMMELKRLAGYREQHIQPILAETDKLSAAVQDGSDPYAARMAALIRRQYGNRSITEFHRVKEFEPLMIYKLSALFLLLLACFCASSLFAGEKETGMAPLLKAAPNGKTRLFWVKLAALFTFVLALGILFAAADYGMFYLCRRPTGASMPFWSMGDFADSPLNISILGALALFTLYRVLGAFALALIAVWFSSLLPKSFPAFLAAVLCMAGLMLATLWTDGFFGVFRYFNPVTLLISVRLFENLRVENVFGYPVSAGLLALLGNLIPAAVLAFTARGLWKRRA